MKSALDELREVVDEGRPVRQVEEGIYTALSAEPRAQHQYDRRAAVYDLLVGTRLYNRLMWGSSPREFSAFARRAINSSPHGPMLDAACGSLLFTARAYLESDRRVIAFDQSLAMLRRARARLQALGADDPERVILLQADIAAPPFRPDSFSTVLCMNVLHHVDDAARTILCLTRLLADGGQVHLTTLVQTGRFVGDRYLAALHAAGELTAPRTSAGLEELVTKRLGLAASYRTEGNMAYVVASASPVRQS